MARRSVLVLVALMAVLSPCLANAAKRGIERCEQPGTAMIAEQGERVVVVDPGTGIVQPLPLEPGFVESVARARRFGEAITPSRWVVARTADEHGRRIQVFDMRHGEQVFDVRFDLRIELATSAVSPSGRYTVYLQSNNIASEVTILDAATASQRTVRIEHGAPLAAYAMAIVFSPDQECAAISMERVGGDGAETWLLNLGSGEIERVPAQDLFVRDWVPGWSKYDSRVISGDTGAWAWERADPTLRSGQAPDRPRPDG